MEEKDRREEMRRLSVSQLVDAVRYEPHMEDWFGLGASFRDEDAEGFFDFLELPGKILSWDFSSNTSSRVYDLKDEKMREAFEYGKKGSRVVGSGISGDYGWIVLDYNKRKTLAA